MAEPSKEERDNPAGTGITYECGDGITAGNCDFNDAIAAAKKVVDWGTTFALAFTVAVLAYAGFNYMISSDVPKAKGEARAMLTKTVIGIAWICGAWLVVTLIASALLGNPVLSSVPAVG